MLGLVLRISCFVSVCKFTGGTYTDTCIAATAVFDGHGGHSAADYMSKNFYKLLSVSIDDETHESERKVESKVLPPCRASSASSDNCSSREPAECSTQAHLARFELDVVSLYFPSG